MTREIKITKSIDLNNTQISRRTFLTGALTSLAGLTFSGCCAFGNKNASSSNSTNQNQQAENVQEIKFGQQKNQETIDQVNREWKRTNKEWNKQKDQEMQEEIRKNPYPQYQNQQQQQQQAAPNQTQVKEQPKKKQVHGFGWNNIKKD